MNTNKNQKGVIRKGCFNCEEALKSAFLMLLIGLHSGSLILHYNAQKVPIF